MTEETNAGTEVSGEDTAAVLQHAAGGEKTYLGETQGADASQDEPSGDDAAAELTEGQAEGDPPKPEKPRRSAQERIDEQTRARREAEREAAHWKRIATEGRQPEPQPTPQRAEDAEPDPSEFTYGEADPAYIRELGRHTARQEFQRLHQEQEQRNAVRSVEQTWAQRQADFAKEHPDYYEKTGSDDLAITPAMAAAIRDSEDGAKVAYHLAENPAEARRIAALNTLAQIREIGRIEARLTAPAAAEPTPLKTVSDAPAPAPMARGLRGQFKPPADTDDFAAFERSYVNGG